MNIFLYQNRKESKQEHCEVCRKEYPGEELCPHHIQGRKNEECIWVCIKCHQKIHANPAWSYRKGYMVKRNTKLLLKIL